MLQNEVDDPVHLCQRADGRKCLKERFRRLPTPIRVNENVEADSRADYAGFTFADLHVFVGWQVEHVLLALIPSLPYSAPGQFDQDCKPSPLHQVEIVASAKNASITGESSSRISSPKVPKWNRMNKQAQQFEMMLTGVQVCVVNR